MPVSLQIPIDVQKYILPDGRLTQEGLRLFLSFYRALQDHENRITALEP